MLLQKQFPRMLPVFRSEVVLILNQENKWNYLYKYFGTRQTITSKTWIINNAQTKGHVSMIYSGVTEYFSQLHCGDDLTNLFPMHNHPLSFLLIAIAKISVLIFNPK